MTAIFASAIKKKIWFFFSFSEHYASWHYETNKCYQIKGCSVEMDIYSPLLQLTLCYLFFLDVTLFLSSLSSSSFFLPLKISETLFMNKKESRGHTRIMSALLKQCLYSPGLRDCRALRSCSETGARAVRSGCCLPLTETKWFPPSWWFLLGNLTRLTKLLPEKKKCLSTFFFSFFFFLVMNDYFQKL